MGQTVPDTTTGATADKNQIIQQRIEFMMESMEVEEWDFQSLFDDLSYYYDNPFDLNSASEEDLKKLGLLSDFEIQGILRYRRKYGKLYSIYELKAIEEIGIVGGERILPFVTIGDDDYKDKFPWRHLHKGNHDLFLRYSSILEEQVGYSTPLDSSRPSSSYLGNPSRLYARYRYRVFDKLSIGFTAENDPGEPFFNDPQTQGFDFYSGHLAVENVKHLPQLVIGDYHMEIGQGLLMWTSRAPGKTNVVSDIQKRGRLVRPYTSTNETDFLRGGAATVTFGKFWLTGFYSNKSFDARIAEATDTLEQDEIVATSFQNSGYHRTLSEWSTKNTIRRQHMGGRLAFKNNFLQVGASYIHSMSNTSLRGNIRPYSKFYNNDDMKNFGGYSSDYLLYIGKLHLFGEMAATSIGGLGQIHGAAVQFHSRLKVYALHRNIPEDFQFFFNNPLTESGQRNEVGTYIGTEFYPLKRIKATAYVDLFKNPWLRFRTDAPSNGREYYLQTDVDLPGQTEMYVRFRREQKGENTSRDADKIRTVFQRQRDNARIQLRYYVGDFTLTSRFEYMRFELAEDVEHGYLLYQDIAFRPDKWPLTLYGRYALFETESYNSRIYAYENDVLYYWYMPAYYNKGSRVYLMAHVDIGRNYDIWVKWSQFYYLDQPVVGSGLNMINGRTKSELRVQLRLKF